MSDLISRCKLFNQLATVQTLAEAYAVIQGMETEDAQEWISVYDRLPEEEGQYIVTVKYEHVDGYEDIYSEHGEWIDGHWDAGFGHCGRVEKVLAWQTLPTPYREGEQDGKN